MSNPQPANQFTYSPHLAQYALPLPTFAASNPEHNRFVVGGLIYTTTANPAPKSKVLLLRRSMHDAFPGYWEGPGGSCEPTDASILAGAAREVFEETGLCVTRFVDLIDTHEWTKVKKDEVIRAVKFLFWVEVEESKGQREREWEGWMDRVKLEPDEHETFVWATEEEVKEGVERMGVGDGLKFLADQGRALLKGFQLYGGN